MTAIVCILCDLFMAGLLAAVLWRFFRLRRKERIAYVKNFKKGKCAVIYLVALPLFWMENAATKKLPALLFLTIEDAAGLIGMKFKINTSLAETNGFFAFSLYFCYALVLANAAMFAVSLFAETVWRARRFSRFQRRPGDKNVIVGDGEGALSLALSCPSDVLVTAPLSRERQDTFYAANVPYQSVRAADLPDKTEELLQKLLSGKNAGKIRVFLMLESEKENLLFAERVLRFIEKNGEALYDRMTFYVFGRQERERLYAEFEERGHGLVRFVDRYTQAAEDFADRFPLTRFMNEKQIDREKFLLRPDVGIHVNLIGFGKMNRKLFLTLVGLQAFFTEDKDGKTVPVPVVYHIFDNGNPGVNLALNHTYFRYRTEFLDEKTGTPRDGFDYLPLPERTEEHVFHSMDIGEPSFFEALKNAVGMGENDVNYTVVSLGDEFSNLETLKTLREKFSALGVPNTQFFASVRDEAIAGKDAFFGENVHFFGSEKSFYRFDRIVDAPRTEMAILESLAYNAEKSLAPEKISAKDLEGFRRLWYGGTSRTDRESNLCAALSLRVKLHMMGLDYVPQSAPGDALGEEEYIKILGAGDPPDVRAGEDGVRYVVYPATFVPSGRKNLAVAEHGRWCAFQLSHGYVPATKEAILSEKRPDGKFSNGKNTVAKTHGNITSFDGLYEFREMIYSRDREVFAAKGKTDISAADVIKYDYQLADGAYHLLTATGNKIVKKA